MDKLYIVMFISPIILLVGGVLYLLFHYTIGLETPVSVFFAGAFALLLAARAILEVMRPV